MINWKIERRKIYRFASFQNYCNWQTTPRFPLKAQTTNSQREPLRVNGLRSNKNIKSERIGLIFQHPQKCYQPPQNIKAGCSPESSMRRKNLRAPAVKACLPMREKRQRDYLIFLIISFRPWTLVRQRDKTHAISRNCIGTIFVPSSPGIKKMFEKALTTGVRQRTLDCYNIIEQSVS